MNEMIERVADAIWPLADWDGDRLNAVAAARAAIEAMREPTLEMVQAAPSEYMTVPLFAGSSQMQTVRRTLGPGPGETFRAMIAAALPA